MEQLPSKLNLARGFLNLGLVVGLMLARQVHWSACEHREVTPERRRGRGFNRRSFIGPSNLRDELIDLVL
jgi:hypothetical protein